MSVASICPIRGIENSIFLKMSDFDFLPQTLAWLCTIPRRGVFFLLFVRHILKNENKWSTKVISGPDFLKIEEISSDFIKLDLGCD